METIPPPPPWWLQEWSTNPEWWHAYPMARYVPIRGAAAVLVAAVVIACALWGRSYWRERDLLRKYRPGHTRR